MSKPDETVKVVVRIRPMSSEEERNGNVAAALAFPDTGLITVRNPKSNESEPQKEFYFDAVYNDNVTQKHIYDTCAASVVESVLGGYNGTIFAYGQTGAGKTHTMMGEKDVADLRGIVPRLTLDTFTRLEQRDKEKAAAKAATAEGGDGDDDTGGSLSMVQVSYLEVRKGPPPRRHARPSRVACADRHVEMF